MGNAELVSAPDIMMLIEPAPVAVVAEAAASAAEVAAARLSAAEMVPSNNAAVISAELTLRCVKRVLPPPLARGVVGETME